MRAKAAAKKVAPIFASGPDRRAASARFRQETCCTFTSPPI